jgi:MerR, DNA binding
MNEKVSCQSRNDSLPDMFAPETVRQIQFIKHAQNLGFSLADVRRIGLRPSAIRFYEERSMATLASARVRRTHCQWRIKRFLSILIEMRIK